MKKAKDQRGVQMRVFLEQENKKENETYFKEVRLGFGLI
jgi:hypothetical protein